ncbi:MAG: hypothetical protein ABSH00_04765 [Bryobacteraceae bacterium]|jgi:hypothetical protein
MSLRVLLSIVIAACAATAQKYEGPKPPKPDLPYIKHAQTLLPTEAVEAKTQKRKDGTLYLVDGANSTAKTPLAAPILLFQSGKINPENLQLFRIESKEGHRELDLQKNGEPIRIEVTKLGDTLSKIEPDDGLDPGEYALLASGSNQVFCFAVF